MKIVSCAFYLHRDFYDIQSGCEALANRFEFLAKCLRCCVRPTLKDGLQKASGGKALKSTLNDSQQLLRGVLV